MSKIWSVARSEYRNAVQSKAFIIGVVLMPVFMGGAILVQTLTRDKVDIADRRFAIVDHTGKLASEIAKAAEQRNAHAIFDPEDREKQVRPRFLAEIIPRETEQAEEERLDVRLSSRVREGELFAFVIIGADCFSPRPDGDNKIAYHTQTPTFRELPNWLRDEIDRRIRKARFQVAGLDQRQVEKLTESPPFERLGLVEIAEDGEIEEAEKANDLRTFAVPAGAMFFLFMLVMMSAPAMLNAVLEEKMQKISEILISSVSPFQLMMGKLLATVLVSLTLSVLYIGAVIALLGHFEVLDVVPTPMYLWFFFFQLLALLIFGSIFIAIGAACSEIRDAQSLMMPAMLTVMIPMFCWFVVLQSPSSMFSRVISLVPPATPMLMLLRIGIPPGPPWWEIALSVALTTLFALACVAAAGKVFRIGILSQGQTPTFPRLIAWIFSK